MARRINVELVTVGSASEAIELTRSSVVDVLISDVLMGDGAGGIELAKEFGRTQPDVSVILMSGYDPSQFELAGLPEGTQFLLKPFTSDALARCIAAGRQGRANRDACSASACGA